MNSRLKKWQKGKAKLAAIKKSQETHVVIKVTMRILMDGERRPMCFDCGHSIMSHGERDGKLFCWGCFGIDGREDKQCQHQK